MADIETQPRTGRYLTFVLGGEQYGFWTGEVREIVTATALTVVPRSSPETMGILNRRGEVIPVLDLARRLESGEASRTPEACIVIVLTEEHPVGVWVDRVSEVLNIAAEAIIPPPPTLKSRADGMLIGFARTDSGLKLLLDVTRVTAGVAA